MARTARVSTVVVACLGAVALLAGAAQATPASHRAARPGTVIEVFPGRHALYKALSKAQPGDTLNVHTGTYKDNLFVTKAGITITAAGDGTVTVNGRCLAQAAIAVRAADVTIQGITVIGGSFYEIDYQHTGDGNVIADTVTDTCGSAEYGVNLYDTQAVNVTQVVASGFSDSGIYVGSISRLGTTTLLVQDNDSSGSEVGIIIEFSSMMHIVVDGNEVSDNSTGGISLQGSDDVVIKNNTANNEGTYGIEADSSSNNNRIKYNTALGNQYDLVNLGQNNCFRHNKYQTHQGPIGC